MTILSDEAREWKKEGRKRKKLEMRMWKFHVEMFSIVQAICFAPVINYEVGEEQLLILLFPFLFFFFLLPPFSTKTLLGDRKVCQCKCRSHETLMSFILGISSTIRVVGWCGILFSKWAKSSWGFNKS